MNEIWSLYGTISLKGFDVATRQLRDLESQARQAGSAMASKLESVAVSAKAAADKLAMLSVPVGALGGMVVKTAVSFEAAMRDVKAVMGATEADMREMWEAAKRLGPELGYAPQKAAEGFRILATSGVKAKDAIAALPGVLKLARATAYDLGATTEAVLGAIRMFNMEVGDTERVADIFVNAISSSMTEMNKLAYSLRYAGPVAASLGWDLEHLVAVLGQLYNAGFQGEQAGTILRGALSRLLDPSKDVIEALKSVGLTIDDVNPRTKTMTEILAALERAHIRATDAVRIFGQEAGPGMLALLTSGSRALADLESKIRATGITADEVAREQLKSLSGQLAQLQAELEALAIELAEDRLEGFAERIRDLRERIHNLSPATRNFIGDLLTMLGAASAGALAYRGLAWVFKTLADAVGVTAGGINSLSALLTGTPLYVRMMTNEFGHASAATRVLYKETAGLAAGYAALIALLGQIPSLVSRSTEAVSRQVKASADLEQLQAEKLGAIRERTEARRAQSLAQFEQEYRRQQILRELEDEERRRRALEAAEEAERLAKQAEAAQARAASSMVSAFRSAMSEVASAAGQASDVARQRLASALEEVAFYARRAGAPAVASAVGEMMGLVADVVSDGSGEAAALLLERLREASEKAARHVKEDAEEAALELRSAYALAAAQIAAEFDAMQRRMRESQIESIDKLHDALVSALRRRYEKEKEERTKAIRDAIDAERKRVDAIIAEIDRERWAREEATNDALRLRIRAIWDEIDALDELTRKEEEERRQAERRARILELQAQIAEETDPVERQKLQMKLAEELAEQERENVLAQREARKRELEKQLQDIRYQQEQSFKTFQAAKEKELDYLENEYYPRLLQDAALQAEAEKMILAGKHAEILELLKRYGEGWKDLGITFGQRLIEGIGPYIDELSRMVSSALEAAGAKVSQTAITKTTAKTTAKTTPAGRALTPEEASVQERYVSEVMRRLGPEKGAEWLKERPTPGAAIVGGKYYEFHEGGVVRGGPLAEFLRRLFSLGPREVPAILEEGEIVLPRTFRLPDLTLKPPAPALAGIPSPVFNFNNCTFLDGTDAGRRAFDEFYSQLRRTGVMRR